MTPLTRAIGEEVGARARLFQRWDLAAALWRLDLDSETVWIGDEGTTEVGGADDAGKGHRARDALRDHALAGGRSRRHVHASRGSRRQRERRRPRAGAQADLGGRPVGAPRAGSRRRARRPALLRHRRSPRVRRRRAGRARASPRSICTSATGTGGSTSPSTSRTCWTASSARRSSRRPAGCAPSPPSARPCRRASAAARAGWRPRPTAAPRRAGFYGCEDVELHAGLPADRRA